jgi:hypothetical protein
MPWRARPLLGVAVVLCLGAAAVPAPRAVWVELTSPAEQWSQAGPVGFVELRGRAGAGEVAGHDVVLLLDVSASTLDPSGADVNGNGRIGRRLRSADDPRRNYNPSRLCTDPGDSVLAASLAAARALLAELDADHARVGLVSFAETATRVASLDAPRDEVDAALARMAENPFAAAGATHLEAGLREGLRVLAEGEMQGPRTRSLVVLTDGVPSDRGGQPRPDDPGARSAAQELVAAGVHIHVFALGGDAQQAHGLFGDLAALSDGSFRPVTEASQIGVELPRVDLVRVAVRVENLSARTAGRAVRLFADGSFDGVVALEPGANRIRVTVLDGSGGSASAERTVSWQRREIRSADEARRAAAVLERLRARTRETELAAEIERSRRAAESRLLELSAESD